MDYFECSVKIFGCQQKETDSYVFVFDSKNINKKHPLSSPRAKWVYFLKAFSLCADGQMRGICSSFLSSGAQKALTSNLYLPIEPSTPPFLVFFHCCVFLFTLIPTII